MAWFVVQGDQNMCWKAVDNHTDHNVIILPSVVFLHSFQRLLNDTSSNFKAEAQALTNPQSTSGTGTGEDPGDGLSSSRWVGYLLRQPPPFCPGQPCKQWTYVVDTRQKVCSRHVSAKKRKKERRGEKNVGGQGPAGSSLQSTYVIVYHMLGWKMTSL